MVTAFDDALVLARIELNVVDAARLCGITARQLNYWTSKGYVQALCDQPRRYTVQALAVAYRIKRSMADGHSLERAVRLLHDVVDGAPASPAENRDAVNRQIALLSDELTTLRQSVEVELLRRRLEACLDQLEQPAVVQSLSQPDSATLTARSTIETAIAAINAAIRAATAPALSYAEPSAAGVEGSLRTTAG